MAKLTGSYNEYGYVIRKNSRVIYAAGNSHYESQTYIGIRRFNKDTYHADGRFYRKGFLLKEAIPEEAIVLSLEEIASLCEATLDEMCSYPDRYDLKRQEYEKGAVKYQQDLNPLEHAYNCGALVA